MTVQELWLAYFALGGAAGPDTVRSYLTAAEPPRLDYDLLAAAINEHFAERGDDHPVPYHEELA